MSAFKPSRTAFNPINRPRPYEKGTNRSTWTCNLRTPGPFCLSPSERPKKEQPKKGGMMDLAPAALFPLVKSEARIQPPNRVRISAHPQSAQKPRRFLLQAVRIDLTISQARPFHPPLPFHTPHTFLTSRSKASTTAACSPVVPGNKRTRRREAKRRRRRRKRCIYPTRSSSQDRGRHSASGASVSTEASLERRPVGRERGWTCWLGAAWSSGLAVRCRPLGWATTGPCS